MSQKKKTNFVSSVLVKCQRNFIQSRSSLKSSEITRHDMRWEIREDEEGLRDVIEWTVDRKTSQNCCDSSFSELIVRNTVEKKEMRNGRSERREREKRFETTWERSMIGCAMSKQWWFVPFRCQWCDSHLNYQQMLEKRTREFKWLTPN